MATWIIGGILVMVVGAIVWKMMKDRKREARACACGRDCSHCRAATGVRQIPTSPESSNNRFPEGISTKRGRVALLRRAPVPYLQSI